MKTQLYFLTDQYYIDFPDKYLMKNKNTINTAAHSRPCFFAFPDAKFEEIYWIVPISSQYEKYKAIEKDKIKKYGNCNTLRFGEVLQRDCVFLIQNMCPATEKYLIPYMDKNNKPININDMVAKDVSKNAKKALKLSMNGVNVVFPDVIKIYNELVLQIKCKTNKKTLSYFSTQKSKSR